MKAIQLSKIAIVFVASIVAVTARASAEVQTWTSQTGTTVEAAFVELSNDGLVTLQTREGERLQIGLRALNEAGQARIQQLVEAQRERELRAARAAGRQLRTIVPEAFQRNDESVLGRFESRDMLAIVYTPSARLDIFVKENGGFLTPPINVQLGIWYRDEETQTHPSRGFVEMIEPPVFRNNVAHFVMKRQHDVVAEIRFELRPDGVNYGYRVQDPDGIRQPSSSQMIAYFPAFYHEEADQGRQVFYSPRMPDGTDRAGFIAKIREHKIQSGPRGRAAQHTVPFIQPTQSVGGGEWFEVGGGAYGPRSVRIEAPRRGGRLGSYIYPDNMPVQGFQIRYRKEDHTAPADRGAEMASLTIR